MDCSSPGSSVRGIFQARILERVSIPSFRGSSPPRDQICVSYMSYITGGFFITEPLGKPPLNALVEANSFFFFFGSKFLKFIILWEMGSSGPVKTPGFRYNSLRGTASRKEAGFLFMRDRPIVI